MKLMPEKLSLKSLPSVGKRLAVSCVLSLLIVVGNYFLQNATYPLFDNIEQLTVIGRLQPDRQVLDADDSLICVNVGLDKALQPVVNEWGDTLGNSVITDRVALTNFLQAIKDLDYKQVFIDIRFETDVATEADSALFATMRSMRDVIVATHRHTDEVDTADSLFTPEMLGASDFRKLSLNVFSRYELLQDSIESAALKLYRHDTGHTVERRGLIYTDNGQLCYNMIFPEMPWEELTPTDDDNVRRSMYMTGEYMSDAVRKHLAEMMKGKLVIIGDFDNDKHQTFTGYAPGTLITYYAYKTLLDGGHRVNYLLEVALFVFFALVCFTLMIPGIPWSLPLIRRIKSPFSRFCLSLVGWSAVLFMAKVVVFLISGGSMPVIIPATIFSLIGLYNGLRKKTQNEINN